MRGKKILGIGLLSMLMVCTYLQICMVAQANNQSDSTFDFSYIADGMDTAVSPRSKTDNTASYVSSRSYRYISNNVYGRYAYAYLVRSVNQDNRAHRLAGRWSPDNISGRY
ncbi:MAG: hypothetical protein K6G05_03690 [Lachnospiraceae bacterium]|nr:hypothetical protein [Lachnospiraceae bacterium]